jgi:putative alpha-1,2-mannosidase
MSAWYIYSALGFYPVDPVSKQYVVGSCVLSLPPITANYLTPSRPFFDKIVIDFPGAPRPLMITAKGAATKKYVKSLHINGRLVSLPIIEHEDIANGGEIVFEMTEKAAESFASETLSAAVRSFRHGFLTTFCLRRR